MSTKEYPLQPKIDELFGSLYSLDDLNKLFRTSVLPILRTIHERKEEWERLVTKWFQWVASENESFHIYHFQDTGSLHKKIEGSVVALTHLSRIYPQNVLLRYSISDSSFSHQKIADVIEYLMRQQNAMEDIEEDTWEEFQTYATEWQEPLLSHYQSMSQEDVRYAYQEFSKYVYETFHQSICFVHEPLIDQGTKITPEDLPRVTLSMYVPDSRDRLFANGILLIHVCNLYGILWYPIISIDIPPRNGSKGQKPTLHTSLETASLKNQLFDRIVQVPSRTRVGKKIKISTQKKKASVPAPTIAPVAPSPSMIQRIPEDALEPLPVIEVTIGDTPHRFLVGTTGNLYEDTPANRLVGWIGSSEANRIRSGVDSSRGSQVAITWVVESY